MRIQTTKVSSNVRATAQLSWLLALSLAGPAICGAAYAQAEAAPPTTLPPSVSTTAPAAAPAPQVAAPPASQAPAFRQAGGHADCSDSWSIPIRVKRGVFLFDTKIMGRPVVATLTTLPAAQIPISLARRLGLPLKPLVNSVTSGHFGVSAWVSEPTIEIGGRPFHVLVTALPDASFKDRTVATIPLQVFRAYEIGIFAKRRRFEFSCADDLPSAFKSQDAFTLPLTIKYWPSIPITVNERPVAARVSLGSESEIISVETAKTLGLTEGDLKNGAKVSGSSSNNAKGRLGRKVALASLALGPRLYKNKSAIVSDVPFDYNLGEDILGDYDMLFDYRKGQLTLAPAMP